MDKRITSILCLFLFLLCSGLGGGSSAAQPPAPLRDWQQRRWQGDLPTILFRELPESQSALAADNATLTGNWSRIVFQSYRDNNWEIYSADADGTNQRRLTNRPASDVLPRLGFSATRILFESNVDGNWDLFLMYNSGINVSQMTASSTNERDGVLSPDGSKIAFSSDSSGNYEIYVWTLSSSPVRVTYDNAPDRMPTWSPDGSRVAWVRAIDNTFGAIWVMKADGSGVRQLTGPLRYVASPVWSPDGQHIGFDCDYDGDYLNEVMVMNADGTGIRLLHDASVRGALSDAWMGSWAPMGSQLLFTRVDYVIRGEDVYIDHLYIERTSLDTPNTEMSDRLPGSGYDANPDWKKEDYAPPQARLKPLPRHLRTTDGSFLVEWSGEDVGNAGLASFDVQYHTGDGDWKLWKMETMQVGEWLNGTLGTTYSFRVRARDYAGNLSAWYEGEGTTTTLYTWGINGQVRDVREQPLPFAVLELDSPAFDGNGTDLQGRYALHCADNRWQYSLRVLRTGYEPLTTTWFYGNQDANDYNIYLPINNLLENGDFEANGLAGWQAFGGYLPRRVGVSHSGMWGALLGQLLEMSTAKFPRQERALSMAADSHGTVHGLYIAYVDGIPRVAYTNKAAEGEWTEPLLLTGISSDQATLMVDSSDTVHVVWVEYRGEVTGHVYVYRARQTNGAWSDAQVIPGAPPDPSGQTFIVADDQGRLHIAWSRFLVTREANGSWTGVGLLPSTPGVNNLAIAGLQITWGHTLHALWREIEEAPNSQQTFRLMYSRRSPGESWWPPQTLVTTSESMNLQNVKLVTAPDGRLYLSWTNWLLDGSTSGGIYAHYMRRSDNGGGSWTTTTEIGAWSRQWLSVIATDAHGHLHALGWGPGNGTSVTFYSRSVDLGATWSPLYQIGGDLYLTTIAVDTTHNRLFTSGQNSICQILNLEETTSNSVLRQAIQIPAGMENPTLSLQYQIARIFGVTPDDRLEINLNGAPAWNTTAATPGWAHVWLDLSAYRGQTLMVDINLYNGAGGARAWAFLDEVSLSAWRPFQHSYVSLPLLLKVR